MHIRIHYSTLSLQQGFNSDQDNLFISILNKVRDRLITNHMSHSWIHGRLECKLPESYLYSTALVLFYGCCCAVFSCVQFSVTPWTAAYQPSLSFTISRSFLKLTSIESMMPSNGILSHPLLMSSVFPGIRVFSNGSALCIRWPKYWSFSFSFSISPSKEYLGLISFRIDWFDLLAVQGTLKSLLQHHNSKASILQCSVFFIVQLSHLYKTTKN